MHDYFITARIECGMSLLGTEVKSLRQGRAQLSEAYARVEGKRLVLHGCHIDPYENASEKHNHDPTRDRVLLVHKRELRKLQAETSQRGTTLIPLAIYFRNGIAKLELGVARGKQRYDKRQAIRLKEQNREIRRMLNRKRQG